MPATVGSDQQEPPSLRGIAHKASVDTRHRLWDWSRCRDAARLLDCWGALNQEAASGVDGVTAAAYAANLQANIEAWAHRLTSKRSRAKRVRRRYMPKGNGKTRPLGIPALEDKRVPWAGAKLLTALDEQDCLACSYGYRLERRAWKAVTDLTAYTEKEWTYASSRHLLEYL